MLIVISPAKTLDYDSPVKTRKYTQPDYLEHSQELIDNLRKKSSKSLQSLMDISPALSDLNRQRYLQWQVPFDTYNARQSVLAFKGDVYTGLEAETLDSRDMAWAQEHLRILSGLYGLLRPLDLMQPYRLEMGTSLKTRRGKSLYEFWGETITEGLNAQLSSVRSKLLVNLASNEYFKSVKPAKLDAEIVTPAFRDRKGDDYKMISFFAKKARGRMSAWIVRNRIKDAARLREFNLDGYYYSEELSNLQAPVFLREEQA